MSASAHHEAQIRRSGAGRVLHVGAVEPREVGLYRSSCALTLVGPSNVVRGNERDLASRFSALHIVEAELERLPFPAAAFDVVISTFALCCVREPGRALAEFRRVLRPSGHMAFLEHTRSPSVLGAAQDGIAAVSRLGLSCRPNRDVLAGFSRAGFALRRVELFWAARSLLYGPLLHGVAVPPAPRDERELGWMRGTREPHLSAQTAG